MHGFLDRSYKVVDAMLRVSCTRTDEFFRQKAELSPSFTTLNETVSLLSS